MNECRFIELFAGVGGLHIGLDRAGNDFYRCVLANQWEPGSRDQFAADIYRKRFPDDLLINDDVCKLSGENLDADMILSSFPCQNYSVCVNKSKSLGIEGEKGVLWWENVRIIDEMRKKPRFLVFENVDRMIISPAGQRGRDFSLMIGSLIKLGYDIEWRIINAADYGMPQRRKRIFMFAFLHGEFCVKSPDDWLYSDGIMARAFPVIRPGVSGLWGLDGRKLDNDLARLSVNFNKGNISDHPFMNAGVVIDGVIYTDNVIPDYSGPYMTLGDILVTGDDRNEITDGYWIPDDDVKKWEYVKGHKEFLRKSHDGHEYTYSEGAMSFPDRLDRPSRTLITSEVSSTPNRFTHVIEDPYTGKLRRLVPLELERLQMFPDRHTEGTTDKKRGFLMGNALVCGIIERIGKELRRRIEK